MDKTLKSDQHLHTYLLIILFVVLGKIRKINHLKTLLKIFNFQHFYSRRYSVYMVFNYLFRLCSAFNFAPNRYTACVQEWFQTRLVSHSMSHRWTQGSYYVLCAGKCDRYLPSCIASLFNCMHHICIFMATEREYLGIVGITLLPKQVQPIGQPIRLNYQL